MTTTARQYSEAGLPWFDYYDGDQKAIAGAEELAGLKSVVPMGEEKGDTSLPENESLNDGVVVGLWPVLKVDCAGGSPGPS